MACYTIDEIKEIIAPIAQKYEIPAVFLFGSYARGEATEDSDIDLLVDLTGSKVRGIQFGALYNDLEEALSARVDLVTTRSLENTTGSHSQQSFRSTVNRERVMIYSVA